MSRVYSTVISISQIIFVAGKTLESLKFLITTNLLRSSSKHENARTDRRITFLPTCSQAYSFRAHEYAVRFLRRLDILGCYSENYQIPL